MVTHYHVTDSSTYRIPEGVKIWNRGTDNGNVSCTDIDTGNHLISLSKNHMDWEMTVYPRDVKTSNGALDRHLYRQQLGEWDTPTAERLALMVYKKWRCEKTSLKYIMIPSWLCIRMISPFLSKLNPLKYISLEDWNNGATDAARFLNAVLIVSLGIVLVLAMELKRLGV